MYGFSWYPAFVSLEVPLHPEYSRVWAVIVSARYCTFLAVTAVRESLENLEISDLERVSVLVSLYICRHVKAFSVPCRSIASNIMSSHQIYSVTLICTYHKLSQVS